jgi:organic hydroperoxide reductase OsmC/OhrA
MGAQEQGNPRGGYALRTGCGRDIAVGSIALGDGQRPARRVTLRVGECPGCHDGAWAALTASEARHLAAGLLEQASVAEAASLPAGQEAVSGTAAAGPGEVTVSLELQHGYRFLVNFGLPSVPPLVMDEPVPLGTASGPNASRLLAAAVANCLAASALFCLRKAHVDVRAMSVVASASLVRNERGRLRVGAIRVRLYPTVDADGSGRLGRCLGLFEDFCVVTQSARAGLDVSVEVEPAAAVPDPPVAPFPPGAVAVPPGAAAREQPRQHRG